MNTTTAAGSDAERALDETMRAQIANAQPCDECGDYGHAAADHDDEPTTPTPESAPPGTFIVGADGQPGNVIGWRGDWVRAEFADGGSVYGPADRVTWRLDVEPTAEQVELERVLRASLSTPPPCTEMHNPGTRPERCAWCGGDVTDANRVTYVSERSGQIYTFDDQSCEVVFLHNRDAS